MSDPPAAKRGYPAILAAEMGDGLSVASDFDDLVGMGPYEVLRLIAYSRRFAVC